MEILPLGKIAPEDVELVGQEIVNLSRLLKNDLPVAPGIAVLPPEIKLQTVLKHYNLRDREIFEQSLTLIRKEIQAIEEPEDLVSALKNKKLNPQKLWLELLEVWFLELRSGIWKEGLSQGLNKCLSAQTVFFTGKIACSGKAFIDPLEQKLTVDYFHGDLTEGQLKELQEITEKSNKVLFLPQVYYFILEGNTKNGKLKIVKLRPFTGVNATSNYSYEDLGLNQKINFEEKPKEVKSTLKIFLDFSRGLVVKKEVDGIFISGEKAADDRIKAEDSFEMKVFKVVEAAESFPNLSVIYKLSDLVEKRNGVRGSLRLIHQQNLLKEDAEVIKFARNKKNLLNVSLAVPFTRSAHEFLKIKRDLATLGISRKGSLKLWLELAVPENIINIEDYLIAGLDGVIINLDELASFLGGFDPGEPESIFYKAEVSALIKFIMDALKILHKAKIPTLVCGSLSLHDEVLELLFEKGVTGIVVDFVAASSLNEHLRFVEKRLVRRKLA